MRLEIPPDQQDLAFWIAVTWGLGSIMLVVYVVVKLIAWGHL